jgi:hypothetical protein
MSRIGMKIPWFDRLHQLDAVMSRHSRSNNGVASLAYAPGIHEAAQQVDLTADVVDTHHGLPGLARQ